MGKVGISEKLLELLVCPKCKGELFYDEEGSLLVCRKCMLGYPVKEDIPIMLVDEAIKLGGEESI